MGRRRLLENQRLENSLSQGAVAVRTEYDRDFARLGERFAVGDGMYSIPFISLDNLLQTVISLP